MSGLYNRFYPLMEFCFILSSGRGMENAHAIAEGENNIPMLLSQCVLPQGKTHTPRVDCFCVFPIVMLIRERECEGTGGI